MNEAKSQNFMLSQATVMIGAMADLMKLNPNDHSLGVVKNFTLNQDKQSQELTAGRTNQPIFSMVTQNEVRASCEAYEYTAKNMSYGLGLDGYQIQEISGDVATLSVSGVNNNDKTHTLTLTQAASPQALANGTMVSIRNPSTHNITLAKVTDVSSLVASNTITVEADVGTDVFPSGSVVNVVYVLSLGSTGEEEYYSAKIQGQLADGTWITLLMPKVKMTSSFSAAFSTDNFGNLPFEWKGYKPMASDPFYDLFMTAKGIESGKLIVDGAKSTLVD